MRSIATIIASLVLVGVASPTVSAADIPAPTRIQKIAPPEVGPVEPITTKLGGPGPSTKPPAKADLVTTSLGLTNDGRMTYIVANVGQSPANSPFVTDLYIAGKREDTIKHNTLPARSRQRVISNLARPDACTATQLRIALDTQQLVNEHDEGNNRRERTLTPPCPDLVVDIDKDSVSNGLKYR